MQEIGQRGLLNEVVTRKFRVCRIDYNLFRSTSRPRPIAGAQIHLGRQFEDPNLDRIATGTSLLLFAFLTQLPPMSAKAGS